jgi:rhamnosyltransferase subunit B
MQPLALPDVEAARSARGLPALERSIFLDWIHSPLLSIALFPASFAAATPEWPHPHLHAGFPLYDDDAGSGLDSALAQFLDAGPPPVVFTAGTAMHDARAFFADAVDASVALGLRALLLAQDAAQLPEVLPPGVIHVPYAPFSLLLPRARALVHHGGVGTLAQALRAGPCGTRCSAGGFSGRRRNPVALARRAVCLAGGHLRACRLRPRGRRLGRP